MGDAVRRVADVDAFGAVHHFASFVGAHGLAVGSILKVLPLAFDVANGSLGLQARRVAFGGLAYRGAYCVATGVVALPGTFRMAFLSQGNAKNHNG